MKTMGSNAGMVQGLHQDGCGIKQISIFLKKFNYWPNFMIRQHGLKLSGHHLHVVKFDFYILFFLRSSVSILANQ